MALRGTTTRLEQSISKRSQAKKTYSQELAARDLALHALSQSQGPDSKAWILADEEKLSAQAQFEAIGDQLGRPIQRWAMGGLLFWLVTLILGGVEMPVNAFVFDITLQTATELSYAMSFGLAVLLLFLAHLAGRLLRQAWSQHEQKIFTANIVLSALALIVLLCVTAYLTILRSKFSVLETSSGVGDIFSAVKDEVLQVGFWLALREAMNDNAAMTVGAINLTGVVLTFLLGFLSHDPDQNFDRAYERFERAKNSVRKLDAKYKKKWNKIVRAASRQLDRTDRLHTAANSAIVSQKQNQSMPLDEEDTLILSSLDHLLRRARRTSEPGGAPSGAGNVSRIIR